MLKMNFRQPGANQIRWICVINTKFIHPPGIKGNCYLFIRTKEAVITTGFQGRRVLADMVFLLALLSVLTRPIKLTKEIIASCYYQNQL